MVVLSLSLSVCLYCIVCVCMCFSVFVWLSVFVGLSLCLCVFVYARLSQSCYTSKTQYVTNVLRRGDEPAHSTGKKYCIHVR
jgi:hypothetical protein